MKKLSKVFLTIAGILHIVCAVSYFIISAVLMVFCIIYFATGSFFLYKYYGDAEAETAAAVILILVILYFILSFVLIGYGIASIVGSRLTFKALNAPDKKGLITAIVFGGLFGVEFGVAGGIIGLIALNKEGSPKKEEPKEIETATEVVK